MRRDSTGPEGQKPRQFDVRCPHPGARCGWWTRETVLPPGLPLCEAGVGRRGLACSAPEGEKHLRSPECSGPRQSPDAFPGQPGLWLGTQWALGERQSAARRAAQAPPLAAFSLGAPCETAWRRWKSGAQADKRGGAWAWAWASFIFPIGVVGGGT